MYLTQKHLSRRTVLKGMGVTMALPFLDAMVPARAFGADNKKLRLVCMEMVHGNAGSTAIGVKKNLFAPVKTGRDFELSPTLEPLAPFKDYVTIVSNTDLRNAEAFSLPEIGGDHFRASAVFLTQSHPKQPEGNDLLAAAPLPRVRDPRVVFDQLFGAGATPEERAANLRADKSILDWVTSQISTLRKE